ncbi:hypothetical protein PAMA_021251 [Pampus argenteus]
MEFPDDLLLAELGHLQLYNDSLFQNNFSSSYNETDDLLPTGVKVTIVVVYMIVCVIGLVGNFLVMYVIIRERTSREKVVMSYVLVLDPVTWSPADECDWMFRLQESPGYLNSNVEGTDVFLGFWPFGNALCKAVVSIDYYNMFTSTFTLTVMSVDRYVAVCHPVKALDMRTPHKAKVRGPGVECIVVLHEPRSHWDPVFGTCVFLFSFLIPVAIISICYSLMVKRLRNVRILSGSKEKDRNLRRITRMVLVVVAAFVVCWTPIQIMVLAQSLGFNLSSFFTLVLMHFCIALGYVNSSLNPVLYAFLDENFKRCFREFCHPSPFRLDTQQSGRMRSIAREVAAAYSCKGGDGGGPGGGTPNPA